MEKHCLTLNIEINGLSSRLFINDAKKIQKDGVLTC